jgi:hypothetical protein
MSVIAAIASALRGEKFIHVDEESIAQKAGLHHHAHRVRIRPGGDGKAVPDLLGSAAERDGATPSPDELLQSAIPGPTAPARRE